MVLHRVQGEPSRGCDDPVVPSSERHVNTHTHTHITVVQSPSKLYCSWWARDQAPESFSFRKARLTCRTVQAVQQTPFSIGVRPSTKKWIEGGRVISGSRQHRGLPTGAIAGRTGSSEPAARGGLPRPRTPRSLHEAALAALSVHATYKGGREPARWSRTGLEVCAEASHVGRIALERADDLGSERLHLSQAASDVASRQRRPPFRQPPEPAERRLDKDQVAVAAHDAV